MVESKIALNIGRLSSAILLLLTACGVKPEVIHTIKYCGGETEVDTAPGPVEKIEAPGTELQYRVNNDGTVTYFSKPYFTDNVPSERQIGELTERHLKINLLGDTDNDGKQNILFKSVCPSAPTPTPSPKPPETPLGKLPSKPQHMGAHKNAFFGYINPPVQVFRRG